MYSGRLNLYERDPNFAEVYWGREPHGRCGERSYFLALPGIQFLDHSALSLLTIQDDNPVPENVRPIYANKSDI
jgi:hypothetical protein